jgi:hypothetical protein
MAQAITTEYPTFTHWADIDPHQYHSLSIDVWCHDRWGMPWARNNPLGVWAIIPSPKNTSSKATAIRVNFIHQRDYLIFCLKWS